MQGVTNVVDMVDAYHLSTSKADLFLKLIPSSHLSHISLCSNCTLDKGLKHAFFWVANPIMWAVPHHSQRDESALHSCNRMIRYHNNGVPTKIWLGYYPCTKTSTPQKRGDPESYLYNQSWWLAPSSSLLYLQALEEYYLCSHFGNGISIIAKNMLIRTARQLQDVLELYDPPFELPNSYF